MTDLPANLRIVETTLGMWSYHLSLDGDVTLCGRTDINPTAARLDSWGLRGHVPSTYCSECETKAR